MYRKRHAEKTVSTLAKMFGAVLVAGPRQVGKTTMLKDVPARMLEPVIERIPLKRIGESEDVANAITFLASEEADYISGTILNVDGLVRF